MLKKFLIGTVVALALLVGVTASAADYGTVTLKVGSTGPAVVALQTLVGALPIDGSFGPITKAKVMIWQQANGLVADGLFGNLSKAKANGSTTTTTTTTTVVNCPVGYTCTSATGSTVVSGGAGDSDLTHYATGEKSEIAEGQSDVNVLGFKVEAIDSDIAVSNVKVQISQTATGSEKLANYIDSVDIYMGSKKVGSADASDFTRTSGSPDLYSKSIALSNAVVKEGDKDAFSVKLNAIDSIDTDDVDFSLLVEVASYRFIDGDGVVSTTNIPTTLDISDISNAVTLNDNADSADVKSWSTNPNDATVAVSETDTTDDVLALAFKLKADTDSSDITITELPIDINIAAGGAYADTAENVINSVTVSIDGKDYDAELVGAGTLSVAGAGDVVYSVDLTDEDIVLSGGDTMEVEVTLSFQGMTENYADGVTIVTASVDAGDISAETASDDTFTFGGTVPDGAALTLSTSSVTLSNMSWVSAMGTSAGSLDFLFTMTAGENDLTGFHIDDVTDDASGTLTMINGDAVATDTGVFDLSSGDSANFRIRYVAGDATEVKITAIKGQAVPDSKQLSPTVYTL